MKSHSLKKHYQHLPESWKRHYQFKEQEASSVLLKPLDAVLNQDKNTNRSLLQKVLNDQYQSVSDPKIKQAIEQLGNENTFTVTTGHQLCLFTGPLFFIYKIASTIQLAKQLQGKYPDKKFIPVYWLASEDHDFEEINHAYIFGQKYEWSSAESGAVGRFSTQGINVIIDSLAEKKGDLSYADSLLHAFRNAYSEKNCSHATRHLVHFLFPNENLLCLDADDARLKSEFIPVMQKELESQMVLEVVQKTNEKLTISGLPTPVNPREINLFYLKNAIRKRFLINEQGDFYLEGENLQWKRKELIQELHAHPENFSPNVLMRPLYQECILPNIAYVGGPGELSYWMQLTDLFQAFSIPFPVLVPRNSMMIIDAATQKKINKLDWQLEDVFKDVLELEKDFLTKNFGQELDLSNYRNEATVLFDRLAQQVNTMDTGLKAQVLAEQKKLFNYLDSLEAKLRRAEKQKNEQSINQIHTLKEKLFPHNQPQERIDNITAYYWKYGPEFIQKIIALANPLQPEYQIIFPDEE